MGILSSGTVIVAETDSASSLSVVFVLISEFTSIFISGIIPEFISGFIPALISVFVSIFSSVSKNVSVFSVDSVLSVSNSEKK